jgi:hypothetical protein
MLPDLRPQLSWSATAGAQTYRVERAGADGLWQPVAVTATPGWTDPWRPGVTLYRVVAINGN